MALPTLTPEQRAEALKKAAAARTARKELRDAIADVAARDEFRRLLEREARLLDQLRHGDVVVVWKLDRLSRSLKDLLHIMDRSGSVANVLTVETKLADVRGEIETLTAHLANSNHRVATTQIDVTLTEAVRQAAPATPSFGDHLNATRQAVMSTP